MKALKGKRWELLRTHCFARDLYTCQICQRIVVTRTGSIGRPDLAVADHIIPRAERPDLSYDPDNIQTLCKQCHDSEKAQEEARGFSIRVGNDGWPSDRRHPVNAGTTRQPFSIPHYVRRSSIPVNLVYGPPASGKTTFVRSSAAIDDVIIDMDDYRQQICGMRYTSDPRITRKAFRLRNAAIHSLANRVEGCCWLIVMAPTKHERDAWVKALGGVTVYPVIVPAETCIERISNSREREPVKHELIGAVRTWFSKHN